MKKSKGRDMIILISVLIIAFLAFIGMIGKIRKETKQWAELFNKKGRDE